VIAQGCRRINMNDNYNAGKPDDFKPEGNYTPRNSVKSVGNIRDILIEISSLEVKRIDVSDSAPSIDYCMKV